MADVTERTLTLLAALQTGRSFTGEELAERLGVSARTLRRDVDRLRGYGYPVDTQPGPGGYYRLAAGAALPPLVLDDDEAVATVLGLATLAATGTAAEGSVEDAAGRAYARLDQYLPAHLRRRVAQLRASLETTPTPAPSASTADLATLADAIQHRVVVRFDYTDQAGAVTARRVEPHRQLHHLMRWYLLAWDTDRGDWRVFRTDRICRLDTTTRTFEPRSLPADTAVDYLRQGFNRARRRVRLTVDAPLAAVADAFRYEDVELAAVGDHRTDVVVVVDTWQWLLVGLAFIGADVTIHEPEEFRAACQAFGARLADC